MAWRIKFIYAELFTTVFCNGIHVLEWNPNEGEVFKDVPFPYQNMETVLFRVYGLDSHCEFWWNDELRHEMNIDLEEVWEA